MSDVIFTPDLFRKLKKEYNKAVSLKAESFMFEGNELLVSYAKYLIQYLETKFRRA